MKPPLFIYVAPETLEAALAARAAYDYSALLAGGQSLIPTLNFRLARPEAIIDLGRVPNLRGIAIAKDTIAIGAMTRQRDVELDDAVHRANPLIRETLQNVAHVVVRNRGTVAGSIAHADAAAELPALLLATGGAVRVQSGTGERTIAAEALFKFHLTTSLKADEIITEVRVPTIEPGTGYAFLEYARRHGDYALAGVCVLLKAGADGRIVEARLAGCGIAARPVRLPKAEAALTGARPEPAAFAEAARAARDAVSAPDDHLATAAYRRHLLETLVNRALVTAAARMGAARS
jgi:carbon-monoxide dehydrogenase medium subunit